MQAEIELESETLLVTLRQRVPSPKSPTVALEIPLSKPATVQNVNIIPSSLKPVALADAPVELVIQLETILDNAVQINFSGTGDNIRIAQGPRRGELVDIPGHNINSGELTLGEVSRSVNLLDQGRVNLERGPFRDARESIRSAVNTRRGFFRPGRKIHP